MARKYKITDTTSSFQKMSVVDGAKKLEYTNVSVLETNKIIISELHQIAKS